MKKIEYLLFRSLVFLVILTFLPPVRGNMFKEVNPQADCIVRAYWPDDNYGSYDYLGVGADLWGEQEETFFKFVIPTIETKIIRVYIRTYWYSFMCETPLSVSASLVSNIWSENTITWNTRPPRGDLLDTDTSLGDREYFVIDIDLDYITQGDVLSFCVYENAPFKPDGLQGNSKERDNKVSTLVVEYEIPPMLIIAPLIVGAIVVGIVSSIIYYKHNKKKIARVELENSGVVPDEKELRIDYSSLVSKKWKYKQLSIFFGILFAIVFFGLILINGLLDYTNVYDLLVLLLDGFDRVFAIFNIVAVCVATGLGIPFFFSVGKLLTCIRRINRHPSRPRS